MPMYPEIMVIPMREELTRLGIEELRTPEEVDQALKNRPGTTMVVVNSICGCAAGRMRPAVRMAMQNSVRPDHAYSVFAGQEKEATERARSLFHGISAVLAVDRDSARWATRLHDAAARHRIARSSGHCGGFAGGVRPVLRRSPLRCNLPAFCHSEERSDEEPAVCRRRQTAGSSLCSE